MILLKINNQNKGNNKKKQSNNKTSLKRIILIAKTKTWIKL